ncbi:metalloprotease family protein [Halosolutus amylolyticus]|uniref:Metalloprotease family protein n=1 Tax=Halosolutus amylolyticus TaxID=2932267 RepID=A0ABD5PR72_9EURY|nr:metalloprotease family protein [Halosolutus amylolyticus]
MGGPPEAPKGNTEPEALPQNHLSRVVWMLSLIVASLLVYTPGIRQSMLASPVSTMSGFTTFATSNRFLYIGAIIAVVPVAFINLVIHEEVHKVASRMAGYRSEVKLKPICHGREPYNYIPDEWINKGEYQLILLAPLFVINLFAASLVIMDISPTAATLGKAFLVVNTATSGDDIQMFLRGITYDMSTIYQHRIEKHSLVVYRSVTTDK